MSHAPFGQDGSGKNATSKIRNVNGEQVQSLIAKLNIISKFLPKIPCQEILSSQDYIPGEANLKNQGGGGGKHVLQEVSIIGHLRRVKALNKETSRAIELGCGTARLSDRLQRSTNARLDHIMIDRQEFAPKHCRDGVLCARCKKISEKTTDGGKGEQRAPVIERVVVDIGSLHLERYFDNSDGSLGKKSLCMSKHLCGPACDLTLNALLRSVKNSGLRPPPPTAIATCCHYLCTWESFTGKAFWEAIGLTEEDFVVATAVSQWASLQKSKKSSKRRKVEKNEVTISVDPSNFLQQGANPSNAEPTVLPDLFSVALLSRNSLEEATPNVAKDFVPSKEFERSFTRGEKSQLGIRIKQLFDLSRSAFCQQQLGYKNVELILYTSRSIENRLLVLH